MHKRAHGGAALTLSNNLLCVACDVCPIFRRKMTGTVPGNWYSTTEQGLCGVGPNCTWRLAKPVKKVWKNCSDQIIGGVVEQKNPTCFQRCPSLPGLKALNRSTVCYTECFFEVVLGPNADRVSYNATSGQGLSAEELIALWDRPFAPDSPCADLLPPHTHSSG